METVRTVVCKLAPTPEQAAEIDATLKAFASACDHIADVARRIHSTNKVKVQAECYQEVRSTFGLSANLTIRAIARVCAVLKVPARAHSRFDPTSVDYDARIFSFREWDWTVSLTLLHSRQRIDTRLGDRQRSALKGRKPTAAVLVKRRDGGYSLHVQLSDLAPEPIETEGVLGVDLGRRRVAVDSDGTIHEATEVNRLRQHYPKVRRSIQAKGTRAAHLLLKRLSGNEARHARQVNHVISRRIIDKAKATGRAVAVEDLTGIQERTKVHKAQRYGQHSWSFWQLRSFLEYKAIDAGVPLVAIDPRNTSKTCHRCGVLGHRDALKFSCTRCGDFDADINAALNISAFGAKVTSPELRVGSILH
jgi:IS605 OrfB family transposase